MLYKNNKNMLKNDNAITINLNDNMVALLDHLASYYQRKPAEYLRILLTPILINEYAKIMTMEHPTNKQPIEEAVFKDDIHN